MIALSVFYNKKEKIYLAFVSKHSSNRESHEKVCENKDICNVVVPSVDIKILDVSQ